MHQYVTRERLGAPSAPPISNMAKITHPLTYTKHWSEDDRSFPRPNRLKSQKLMFSA